MGLSFGGEMKNDPGGGARQEPRLGISQAASE